MANVFPSMAHRQRARGVRTLLIGLGAISVCACLASIASADPVISATKTDALAFDSDSDGAADPGDTISYTVTIANSGDMDAETVMFTDLFSSDLDLQTGSVSTSAGTVISGNTGGDTTVEVSAGTIAPGTDVVISFEAAIASPLAATEVSNQGTVSGSNFDDVLTDDPDAGGDADPTVTPVPRADLSIAITNNQTETAPGASPIYTITVRNNGPSEVIGASVATTLPEALTSVEWTCQGVSGGVCTPSGSGSIDDSVRLPVGARVEYTLTGTFAPMRSTTLFVEAEVHPPSGVDDGNLNNNADDDIDAFVAFVNVSVTKTNGIDEVSGGEEVTYTITATNEGGPIVLYGISHRGGDSTLHTIDPATGDSAPIGAVGFDTCRSLEVDSSGALLATCERPATDILVLVSINPFTGQGTEVGPTQTGDPDDIITDISLRSDGALFGYAAINGNIDQTLHTINTSNGAATSLGLTGDGNFFGLGMSFDEGDTLFHAGDFKLFILDQTDATTTEVSNLTFPPSANVTPAINAMELHPETGEMFVAIQNGTGSNSVHHLAIINLTDGTMSAIGRTVDGLQGIAFSPGFSANGVQVTDSVPIALENVSWECVATGGATCTASGTGDINDSVDLPMGGAVTYELTGTIAGQLGSEIVNTVELTLPTGFFDPAPSDNSATDTDNLRGAPSTSGIANVTVSEDADPVVINLFTAFEDDEDPDSALTYTVELNSNPGLFSNITIDGAAGTLTLAFPPNANGAATLTVRALDTDGTFVETTFSVTVQAVNDAPVAGNLPPVTVSEDGPDSVIDIFAAFSDVETADAAMQYTIVMNSNPDLFDEVALNTAMGALTLRYAENENGTSEIVVRARDEGGLTAEAGFTVTVNPVNDRPLDISISSATVEDNLPPGLLVGVLSTADIDVGDTHTYELVSGTGSSDNGLFMIDGDGLRTAAVLDATTNNTLNVRIRSTDSGGASVERAFDITVTPLADALCESFDDIENQLPQFIGQIAAGNADIDGDGLTQEAALRLVRDVACSDSQDTLWAATLNAYHIATMRFDEEENTGPVQQFREVIAANLIISASSRNAVINLLADAGVNLAADYEAVTCAGGLDPCTPEAIKGVPLMEAFSVFPPNTKGLIEPYAGTGDMDGDGLPNREEFENVMSVGGTLDNFVTAARDASLNGTEFGKGAGCGVGPTGRATWLDAALFALLSVIITAFGKRRQTG